MKKDTAIAVKQMTKDNSTIREVIVREGTASVLREPLIVNISGTIDAPRKFIEKRAKGFDDQKVNVTYCREQMKITLQVDENNYYGSKIVGSLQMNKDLQQFGVNSSKMFTVKELQSLLKMNRYFFADKDKNMHIVGNLGKFTASIKTQLQEGQDTRGNKNESVDIKVDSNLDLEFMLSMPIFTGQPAKKFKVEICFDVRDANISVWLESAELRELILKTRDEIIDQQLSFFSNYVVIEQ